MSDTHLPASEYVKQGIFIIVILALCIFGIKTCRKFQAEKNITLELSSHTSESAAYEQFYRENAEQNLLKTMFHMHSGVKMGKTPSELLTTAMEADKKDWFSSEEPTELPIRKVLIRDALLSNYNHCLKLGVFEDKLNLKSLSKGEFPTISIGPDEGEQIIIIPIIPSEALPGAEMLLPNMIISPPLKKGEEVKKTKPTEFEIARAKRLAQQLTSASLIEKSAYSKVIDYYKQLASTSLPEQ